MFPEKATGDPRRERNQQILQGSQGTKLEFAVIMAAPQAPSAEII